MKKTNTVADLKTKFAEYNPRTITDEQLKNLKRSLKKFGDLSGVVLNVRSGNIVGGHQRLKSLDPKWKVESKPHKDKTGTVALGYIQTDDGRFQYREVDWDTQTEKGANLAANKHGGEFDLKKLDPMLKDLKDSGFDLSLAGFGDEGGADSSPGDDTEAMEPPKDPKTNLGELWLLGDHRLLCGDSTNEEDVKRLMDGKKADMVLTDPPYGIKRDKGFGGFGGFGTPIKRREYAGGWDGERPPKKVFDLIISLSENVLIFGGNYFADMLPQGKHWIVWDKKNTMPTFGDAELIWTNIKRDSVKIKEFVFNGLIGKEKERHHPTQKPIDLLIELLNEYSKDNSLTVDLFLGSGSTLIACENTKRKCYGMELDPAYCDVIIDRWERHTGKKATLDKA